ncbi:MAG: biopolymer transporter ExbD [Bacteriovoracaceae bacterium]|nr:biopolymer transporter ExbD [Bacteriovoracaceae bacterium]
MAFDLGKKKGMISEINVTPLVDVMLVLLVIFMITAPLMLNGIKLDLPKTKEVNPINLSNTQVVLSMTKTGEYFIGNDKYLYDELVQIVRGMFEKNRTTTLYLRADSMIRYGKVASMMSYLKKEGVTNIALVTEIDD